LTLSELARQSATDYIANEQFTEATLFFADGSFLQFVHKSRDERWARPSADDSTAGMVCQGLRQFRLNAKHLQLYFDDGDAEFFAQTPNRPSIQS
jgi:hypothetical protein